MSVAASRERLVRWALLLTLPVLLAHAAMYRFLCDDAFISFRYARNLAQGDGLVFNPGLERVEGYTNFLWVIVLAVFDRAGLRPEHAAPVLSMLLTVALWALVARASWRWIPAGSWRWAVPLPAAWLAMTRTVAVWSTSGLETRLFEVLVVAAVFRLIEDVRTAGEPRRTSRVPWSAALFGLAALTRPDGLLIGGAAMGAAGAVSLARRRLRASDAIAHAAVFAAIVGGHLLFRHAYYGDWVPNTYYAKVGGRSWWDMGAAYLACFVVEYAAWLWIPLLIAGTQGFAKDRRPETPLILAAAVLPHALYIASIGGDHFEYRPLDLYVPLLFVLMGRGAAALAEGALPRPGVAVYAAVLAIGLVAIPWQSHRQFTTEYAVGFPGLGATRGERLHYLDPARDPVYRWPGLRVLAEAHRNLLRGLTSRLIGVRQEEHRLFLATVRPEGRRLRALVEAGLLPTDTHVALSAVGAIPYESDLRVLDRLGLTDATVARSAPGELRIMAHDRHATFAYAAERGVDLWAEHPVHVLFEPTLDGLWWVLQSIQGASADVYFAETDQGFVVARLPQGIERARERFPLLVLRAASDAEAVAALHDRRIAMARARLTTDPASSEARLALATSLAARGRGGEAYPVFEQLAREGNAEGWYNVGTMLAQQGRYADAAAAFRRALAIDPDMTLAFHNLGLSLVRAGRTGEGIDALREAVRLQPESERALYTLGVALLTAGDRPGAQACARSLQAMGTVEGSELAQRLFGVAEMGP